MEADKKRLLWGLALAWGPALLVVAPTVRAMSSEKATGLGVVAAWTTESLTIFGLIAFLVAQVAGIVLLVWEIRRSGWGRTALCLFSIGSSLVVLTMVLLSAWWLWHRSADTSTTHFSPTLSRFFQARGSGATLSAGR